MTERINLHKTPDRSRREDIEATSKMNAGEHIPTPEGETWERIIVVSNRLPFKVVYNEERNPSILASSGGLVTAMSPLLQRGIAGKWIGWTGVNDEEEGLEEALQVEMAVRSHQEQGGLGGSIDIGIVNITREEEENYYKGYSNEVLTPLFLGAMDKVDLEKAKTCWPTYQGVQRKFAEKIQEDLGPHDIVWVHDYHLMGVGKELQEMGVRQPTGFFLHIPFPTQDKLAVLPQADVLTRDLLAYDIVGFQTNTFKQHFIDAVREYVPEAVTTDTEEGLTLVQYRDRITRLGSFPVSIDPREFSKQLGAPETHRNVKRLERVLNEKGVQMIFNAGRQDYTKGFYEELLAFDRLLEKHPDLVGKLILYQLVIPSRESIPAYAEYKTQITDLAKQINQKYKSAIVQDIESDETPAERYAGMPVRQTHTHMNRERYLAHLNATNLQSVPTLADGMNLVSKEGAVVGNPLMVQVLGKEAGAAEELGEYVILTDPTDTEAFADALYQAYTMAKPERRERKRGMYNSLFENDVFTWWSRKQEPAFQAVWDEKKTK